ncbi:MAG: hypothetical protein JWM61_518 [Micrococcaceae bacterium]|nr:hypothetical protein [Micrococcaceae bacterium]
MTAPRPHLERTLSGGKDGPLSQQDNNRWCLRSGVFRGGVTSVAVSDQVLREQLIAIINRLGQTPV